MILRWTFAFLWIASVFHTSYAQGTTIDHWETVVMANDTWHYFIGVTSGPSVDWQNPDFNDASWSAGQGGFGYGDDINNIPVPPNPYSIFTRITFTILDTAKVGMALLNMDFDDGFVAWLNGVEIARSNLGEVGDHPDYNTPAVDHEALMHQGQNPPSFQISKQLLSSCLINGSNVLAIQVNNVSITSSDLNCIPYLSLGMKTAGHTYRNVPAWFEDPYDGFAGSLLPLVIVNTNSSVIQDGVKTMVDLGIIDNGEGNVNHLSDAWNNYSGKAGIEIRGSSSTMFDKKNYALELWTTTPNEDTASSILGMPKESDWILHGPYSDKSLIRNYLAYKLARDMGNYASRTRFCELFIDGDYRGVYVMLERIKRDSNRVNISKLKTADVVGDQLTGGYIVKIDRSAGDYSDGWFSPYYGAGDGSSTPFFVYSYPKAADIVPIQKNYIQNKITAFENALHGYQYLDPYIGYKTFIDVNSFVDYFILVELSKNVDGYRLSTFLHKDRDSKDPRIHMGPVWDYDLAFGNADYYQAFSTYGWNYSIPADMWGTPFWWNKFMSDPYFVNVLYCRWHEFRQSFLSDESLTAMIDTAVLKLGPASDRNFDRWPIHGIYVWPNAYVGNTYTEDVTYMKTWITGRAAWMDSNIPGSTCLSPVDDKDATFTFLLRAYPNPAVEQVNIEVQNERSEKLNLEIFNYTGQLVYEKQLSVEPLVTEKVRLRPGAYLIKVTSKECSRTEKIMVQ